jgi:hypothetical protein
LTGDPTLAYSTYLGGSLADKATAVAVDPAGDVYVTGDTASTDFPYTTGSYSTKLNGTGSAANTATDVFVAKFNPAGQLVYATYLGGSSDDHGTGIAIDASGDAYVTGWTDSTDFPVTPGAFQQHNSGAAAPKDGFVTELNSTGSQLVYSTYLGGTTTNEPHAIAVDSAGDAYVVGQTFSDDFPTKDPIQAGQEDTATDAFLVKLNATGTALVFGTYLQGSANDEAYGVAVDPNREAIVVGGTDSTDFPTTPGAFQTTNKAASAVGDNAFVTKFNAAGTGYVYSTFLGGSVGDDAYAVATDAAGDAYITGQTSSPDFPVTYGAAQMVLNGTDMYGESNAFAAKLDPSGGLVYSTFLGGGGNLATAGGMGIAVDGQGDAYITGFTDDTTTPFPTVDAFEPTKPGNFDAFVTRLAADGSTLDESSYLGGAANDYGNGIGVDASGNAYIVGEADSFINSAGTVQGLTDTFPTVGAINSTPPAPLDGDGFVTRVNPLDPGSGTFGFDVNPDGPPVFQTTEAAGIVTIAVTRQGGDAAAASVSYATSNGTAAAGVNYTATMGTLNFAQGQTLATFNVPILDDHVNDGTPYLVFDVTLSNPTSGATIDPQSATSPVWVYDVETTNADNDLYENAIPLSGPSVRATGSNVGYDSDTGLIPGGDSKDIFDYSVTDSKNLFGPKNPGGASAWWIWSPSSTGIATIRTSGSSFDTLLAVLGGGHLVENDDAPGATDGTSAVTFLAQAGVAYRIAVQGYDGSSGVAQGNIVLDINEAPIGAVELGAATFSVNENAGSITIPVSFAGGISGAVSAELTASGGTAVVGTDYASVTQTLDWASVLGNTQMVTIPILDRHLPSGSVTVDVALSNATGGAELASPSTAVLTILDNDIIPGTLQLGAATYNVNEDAGNITIPVSRTGGSGGAVSVVFSTGGGTAVAGTDYTSVTQTLNWADGDTSTRNVTIPILDNPEASGDEIVNVILSSPTSGASLGTPSNAALTIHAANAVFQFSSGQFAANATDGTTSVQLTRSGNLSSPVTVVVSSPGRQEIAAFQQTISFGPNTTSATVPIPILNDGKAGEPDATITLSLSSPGPRATLGAIATASLVIHDNNPLPPVVKVVSLQPTTETIKTGTGRKSKTKKEPGLMLQFSGNLTGTGNPAAYQLRTGQTRKGVTSFTKNVPLAVFSATPTTVILVPAGKLTSSQPEQLRVTASALTDAFGRSLEGGQSFTATFGKNVVTSASVRSFIRIAGLSAAAVDQSLASGFIE